MTTAWKIPRRWTELTLCDRTVLYPALYLRWSGIPTTIGRDIPAGRWNDASLRVLISDGPLAEDERDLMQRTAARGEGLLLLPQAGIWPGDVDLIVRSGCRIATWIDEGPLMSAPPHSGGRAVMTLQGCVARQAEDMVLFSEVGGGAWDPLPYGEPAVDPHFLAIVSSADSFLEIWPALKTEAARSRTKVIACTDKAGDRERIASQTGVQTVAAGDPGLLSLIASARIFLCAHGGAAPDSPRPGQWVRSALYQGVPVIAASHPSIDGLAHLCVLDDWERGLALYGRIPVARLMAGAQAQAWLDDRLEPERIAPAWAALIEASEPHRALPAETPTRTPLLLVLIDIHQDLDILLPVLLALRSRAEVRLRIALTDWLVTESPRVLNTLAAHGFSFDIYPRDEVRRGDAPLLGGVDGVLSGAETNVRAHKSGHTLVGRARARGAASFTLQHGFENIGLTYKDGLHDEGVRFASDVIFTWCGADDLADWIAPETRAAVVPVGSPKTVPSPASPTPLHQGFWARTVGVFENLHWARFSEVYRERFIEDLRDAASANPDTLFLVKPHHAGRWASRHRDRIAQTANLVVVDPTDSAWEPHTAPALIASVDRVLTTPSTVALDAARTGRPVAVLGYDLDLPLYAPLPVIRVREDLARFLDEDADAALLRNEAFLARARLPGRADHRIAALIAGRLRNQAQTTSPTRRNAARRRVSA